MDRMDAPTKAPPASRVMSMYMQYWMASAVLAAVNLGVADAVGSVAQDVGEIARAIDVDEHCLFRLMRALASAGVFREETPRHFTSTPMSAALRRDSPSGIATTIRALGLKSTREAMLGYETAIKTGRSAFDIVHGRQTPFDVIADRPDETAIFHEGMTADNRLVAAILRRYDFGDLGTLVDVGGGTGAFLAAILQEHPAQRGVLFDLPGVGQAALLAERGLSSRCEIQNGDMRTYVPAGGDGYILRRILHGWPDAECVALLRRIRQAGSSGVRVLIIENVMPEGNDPAPSKMFDLFLLLGGSRSRVRTEAEMRCLLHESGFSCARLFHIVADQYLIEGRLA